MIEFGSDLDHDLAFVEVYAFRVLLVVYFLKEILSLNGVIKGKEGEGGEWKIELFPYITSKITSFIFCIRLPCADFQLHSYAVVCGSSQSSRSYMV